MEFSLTDPNNSPSHSDFVINVLTIY